MKIRRRKFTHQPTGYTLIELTFSIAFLSMLVLGATLSFVNILGIYNRAQGLTRTQSAARDAISVISRDLLYTSEVEERTTPLTLGGMSTDKVTCLTSDRGSIGYALLTMSDGKSHLARLQSCNSLTNYQLLAPAPTWSTSSTSQCSDAFLITDAGDGKAVEPKTWKATVRISHGERNPCPAPGTPEATANDTFAATTVLETHVLNQ